MRIMLNTNSIEDYAKFLRIKSLPSYRIRGCVATFADEYAAMIDGVTKPKSKDSPFTPSEFLFDYQKAIAQLAVRKRKYAIFADCGLGKTLIYGDWAKHVLGVLPKRKKLLIVSPLMVVEQTIAEFAKFYGDSLPCEQIPSGDVQHWLDGKTGRLGITNFEAMNNHIDASRLGGLVIDESSMLKSHYGAWGMEILRIGRGLEWKLCGTGTPAPNDRIEYANHAVFVDAFPNVNSFLARFFVNRGQTSERWELKKHALTPFYRALSHWCIFLTRPSVYGWHDHSDDIPPIHVHIHDVPLTDDQRRAAQNLTGHLVAIESGGIGQRSKLSAISKGWSGEEGLTTLKWDYIRDLVAQWPNESTIIWCHFNREQDAVARTFPDAANISGDTPHDERMRLIDDFKSGRRKILISKPKILGFGLNLQVATRQVFSGLQDSYESFYQAVKRSNRVGSTRPLNVHIPVTELERPMIQTVLEKANRVQQDAECQEDLFREQFQSI